MTLDLKRLRELIDADWPATVDAVRNCVRFYVSHWYAKPDGGDATLKPDSPAAKAVDALEDLPAALDEVERLRALLKEACATGRQVSAIALDLVNGRAPSISTSEMVRSRMDRLAAIAKEVAGE